MTPQTVAHKTPLSMARILERIAIPSLGDLSDPEIEPGSQALQVGSLPSESPGKPRKLMSNCPTVLFFYLADSF